MYTNVVFGTAKTVLYIEVSLFQSVLIEGFHCSHQLASMTCHWLVRMNTIVTRSQTRLPGQPTKIAVTEVEPTQVHALT